VAGETACTASGEGPRSCRDKSGKRKRPGGGLGKSTRLGGNQRKNL